MEPKERVGLLRKATADAYGEDRSWMLEDGRATTLVSEARLAQELLLLQRRTMSVGQTLDVAIREIEGLCLLVEELVRDKARPIT